MIVFYNLLFILSNQYTYDPTTRLIGQDDNNIFWTILQWLIIGGAIIYYFIKHDNKDH